MISGLLALLSAIALIHYQRSVIQVIAAAALSGVIIQSLM